MALPDKRASSPQQLGRQRSLEGARARPAAGEFLRTGSADLPIATDRRFLLGLKCNNRPCHSIHANPILMLWVIISPLTTVTLVNRRLGLRRFRLR